MYVEVFVALLIAGQLIVILLSVLAQIDLENVNILWHCIVFRDKDRKNQEGRFSINRFSHIFANDFFVSFE